MSQAGEEMEGPTNRSGRNRAKNVAIVFPFAPVSPPLRFKGQATAHYGSLGFFNGWVCSDAKVIGS